MESTPHWYTPQVEHVAQALFDRYCERCERRGTKPHHPSGTRVKDMPSPYRDDYWLDALAAINASEQ